MRATPLMLAIALGLGLPAASSDAAAPARAAAVKASAPQTYIIVFDESPAASFRGFGLAEKNRPRLAATSPAATGARKYNARSVEAVAYVDYLADLRRIRLNQIAVKLLRPVEAKRVYSHAMNGIALELSADEARQIEGMPGIRAIAPSFKRKLDTSHGPRWVNADDIWNGVVPGVAANRGAGVIVGVIDSGVNRTHNAFQNATGISNPLGSVRGFCATNAGFCNNKLIGAWDFTTSSSGTTSFPTDSDGHGTHTASTAAGNPFQVYSGVAPQANLIVYKGCPDDECDGDALIDAIDQAVADGVDVINYSIGAPASDPWITVGNAATEDSEAFLAAREAGIVVAASAGNSGPAPGTHGNPSNSPWVIGVAAATHDRNGVAGADILAGFSGRGPVVPFNVLKPDISAPGVSIIAAGLGAANSISQLSGTSMAAPHVAGAAALLKAVNPAFTADQIVSALLLTARPSVRLGVNIPADPHDQGAGMLDVAAAARAGLYLEVPPNAFRSARANAFTGGAESLNVPSLAHGGCFQTCVLTRTFKLMPGAAPANYSIQVTMPAGTSLTPSVASIDASAAGSSVNFTVDVSNAAVVGEWIYGTVTLVNNSGDGRPNLRLPVAVYSSPYSNDATAVTQVNITAPLERGFTDVAMGSLIPMPNARFETTDLATPVSVVTNITVDPTNDEIYDDVNSNYVSTIVVPANPPGGPVLYKVRVETFAAAPDIDLFVGLDTNGNGLPERNEQLCTSTSSGSNEVCELSVTTSGVAQTVWLMAQNWAGAGTNVRIEKYALAMQSGSGNSLRATGPGHLAASENFSVRIAYDDATMTNGSNRIGYLLLQPTPGATALEIPVRISRVGAGFAPYALAHAVPRAVTLPAGEAHDRLFFDVPANAGSVTFATTGTGSVSLYAARVATPAGPGIDPAPARNAPGVLSSTAAGAAQTITATGGTLQPGRWYVTPVNTGGTAASVNVTATINSSTSALTVKRGSYYNPARGGHGVFQYPAGPEQAVLWYTYFQDQSPTWYYMQAPAPGTNGSWNTPIFRGAWNGSSNVLVPVGNVVMTATSDSAYTMAYNLDGFTGAEPMQAFLTGCPGVIDTSGHWFDPARAGSGYSVQAHPGYEFNAAFIYDGQGRPRFLAAERGGAFAAGNTGLQLDQLRGFAPLGAYSAPVRTPVGSFTRTYGANAIASITLAATFTGGVAGSWNVTDTLSPLGSTQGCAP